jgi:hypothetical protein
VVGRWHFLVAVVVSVFAFAGTAQATPTFLSAIDISEAGQDAFEPQVINDASGNVHAVWTRSDGVNFRIQYSTRTAGGDWSTPVNLSDATQSASQPQIDADPSGNLLVVWTRFDGANNRHSRPRPAASAPRPTSPTPASTPPSHRSTSTAQGRRSPSGRASTVRSCVSRPASATPVRAVRS